MELLSPDNRSPANKCMEKIDYIEKVVNILSIHRAEEYIDWLHLGWCLYNIGLSFHER